MKASQKSSYVSRIDQKSKRPMAQAIKDEKKTKKKLAPFHFIVSLVRSIREHIFISASLFLILVFIGIVYFTPVFAIQNVSVTLDDRAGCLSKEYVEQYMRLHVKYMWSVFLYSEEDLLDIHSCADRIVLNWNPFSPHRLEVAVLAHKPIFKVRVQTVSIGADVRGDAQSFFTSNYIHDDIRFMLNDGRLIQLDSEPSVPEIVLKIPSDISMDTYQMPNRFIHPLLQLIAYFKDTLDSPPNILISDTGIVRVDTFSYPSIYFSLRTDLSEQLRSLQAFLGTSTIDRSKLEIIDVRYGYVIVHGTK